MGVWMEELWRYLPALILLVQVIMGWALWSLRKEFVTIRDCDECRSSIIRDVNTLERCVTGMPDTQTVHDLALAMERFSGDVRTLQQRVEGSVEILERVERVVARHEDHLLNGGR